jgi:hypothetical protein
MVANENWEVFKIHAVETYDMYHTAVFVESNTTHMAGPRKMNFYDSLKKDILQRSGMMGKSTKVMFRYWLLGMPVPNLIYMDRESEQRNTIITGWKDAGMTEEDVGLMADIDETFSRDFLRAIQTCDFVQLRTEDKSCKAPKVIPMALSFEVSPWCLKKKEWFHPDVIAGHCVEGIGDPTERVVPLRMISRSWGERSMKYGLLSNIQYPEQVLKSGLNPLFSGPDIRTVHGDRGPPENFKDRPDDHDTAAYGVAYHFHNWFKDGATIRNKYLTYAHAGEDVEEKTLSQLSGDMDIFVRCAKGLDNDANPNDNMEEIYFEGWKIEGPRPIYFLNKTYSHARHADAIRMMEADEEKYGTSYAPNGTWIESTKMTEAQIQKHRKPILKKRKPKKKKFVPNEESRHATVIGVTLGLQIESIHRFVGSLRKTGFSGNIILGVEEKQPRKFLRFLENANNVTVKTVRYAANCTFEPFYKTQEDIDKESDDKMRRDLTSCAEPYPDVKLSNIKYPLGRDWLRDCKTCTGPVMLVNVREVYFQEDPFGPEAPEIKGIQLFEEHPDVTTKHWVVDWPVGDCKGVHNKKPMISGGAVVGTSSAMMKYMEQMYEEMKAWLVEPKCRFKTASDEQPVQNFLFYNGDLKDAEALHHRDGIVHVVGYETSQIFEAHLEKVKNEEKKSHDEAYETPLPGKNNRTWISPEIYSLTDEDGYFMNFDGSRSRVVYQWDAAGQPLWTWMQNQEFLEEHDD